MKKPIIRICWTKLHPDYLAKQGGRESPIYRIKGQNGSLSTNSPDDCLVYLICNDIETGGRMECCNNSYIWTDDNWIPVIGTTPKWPKYSSGQDYPTTKT